MLQTTSSQSNAYQPTNPDITSQSTTLKDLALLLRNKDNSWFLALKDLPHFSCPEAIPQDLLIDSGLDQVPCLAIKLFHLVHNLWSLIVVVLSLTVWGSHRDHMIEIPSEADRPLTLKNLQSPEFSTFLAPSDGDSADFSSEFVRSCLKGSVYSGSELSGFS